MWVVGGLRDVDFDVVVFSDFLLKINIARTRKDSHVVEEHTPVAVCPGAAAALVPIRKAGWIEGHTSWTVSHAVFLHTN